MVAGFDAVAQAVGDIMFSGDATAGGLLCGFVSLVVIYLIFLILFPKHHSGINSVMPLAMGVLLVALVGWFPIWTVLFIVVIVAFVLLRPFDDSSPG